MKGRASCTLGIGPNFPSSDFSKSEDDRDVVVLNYFHILVRLRFNRNSAAL